MPKHNDFKSKFVAANKELANKLDRINLPELDLAVYVKPMTVAKRAELSGKVGNNLALQIDMVLSCTCNDLGEPLFDPNSDEDREFLLECEASTIDKISNGILGASKMTGEAIETTKKNS